MIFVTVGTHEQPFNRLIQKIDELKKDGTIQDDVIIQTGFSTYEPKYCQWSKLIPYQQMVKNVADARIVITHGGPASFIMPLQIGKTPIVVPRQHQFNEHVNDHQVEFARNVAQRMGTIIPVEDIETLGDIITNYDRIVAGVGHGMSSNNERFNKELEKLVEKQMEDYELKPAPGNPDRVRPSITARLKDETRGQEPPKEPGQKRNHKNHEER